MIKRLGLLLVFLFIEGCTQFQTPSATSQHCVWEVVERTNVLYADQEFQYTLSTKYKFNKSVYPQNMVIVTDRKWEVGETIYWFTQKDIDRITRSHRAITYYEKTNKRK